MSDLSISCSRCGKDFSVREIPYDYTQLAGLDLHEYQVTLHGISVYECGCGVAPEIPNVEGLHYALGVALITKDEPIRPSGFLFLRKTLGLTQAQFANHGRIRAEFLSQIENGHVRASDATETQFRLAFLSQLLKDPGLKNHFTMPALSGVVQNLIDRSDEVAEKLRSEIDIECPPAWMIKDAGIGSGTDQDHNLQ